MDRHTTDEDLREDAFEPSFLMRSDAQTGDQDERQLRPLSLSEYFGQEKVKQNLSVYIAAARQRLEALDHVLLYGPPGLGKTTLAGIIAQELGAGIKMTTGPSIEKTGDLAALLTNLDARDVLFIDEIHRLPKPVEEVLYAAMEDYRLDIMVGMGPGARSLRLELQPFTLVGATTRAGLLSAPLRDRFGIINRLELYKPEELAGILRRDAAILGIGVDEAGLSLIACRSRGTPRIAIRLLKRLRDFAQIKGEGIIDADLADYGLNALDVDQLGLDAADRKLLRNLAEYFGGGPAGLDTLAASTGEDATTIEDVYEPFLMQLGFLAKTPRGRVLTRRGWEHLKLPCPDDYERRLGRLGAAVKRQGRAKTLLQGADAGTEGPEGSEGENHRAAGGGFVSQTLEDCAHD